MAESRTQKSIRNAKVALFFSVLTFALGFFSRKILLDALGADILGLYTTANNLCGFLNMAEMGITSAVAFSLYKPIFDNDRQAITEIVSIQGWLFRYVGVAMIVGAVILMACFPVFFSEEKTHLPLWYSYATFGVVFLSQVLGYFFCYQQTLLFADQQSYRITYSLQSTRCVKLLLQVIGIGICGYGFVFLLMVELACGILSLLLLNYQIQKCYPWLTPIISNGSVWSNKHPRIIQKAKQLAFHRLSSATIDKVTPVIIYGILSLKTVAIYGNYLLVITNVSVIVEMLFSGVNASVGNLVAEGNKQRILSFFCGYKAFRYWLVSIICFSLYYLFTPFMILWMGEDYIFDNKTIVLLILYLFVSNTGTCGTFLNAYGLFQDIYSPIIEAVVNVGLSILLGCFYGVKGILMGVLISMWIIFTIWKPYFLYTRGFRVHPVKYFRVVLFPILSITVAWTISSLIIGNIPLSFTSFGGLMLSTVIIVILYAIISMVAFLLINPTYRDVLCRLVYSVKR